MFRISVASSNLRSIGYDASTHILEIEFNSFAIYQYSNVPVNIYNGLMSASSKGHYFSEFIKDKYPYRRIA